MPKKKIKTEYIIIAVIIVLAVYLLLKKTDKVQYTLPDMDLVKQTDIDKIDIVKPDATFTVNKKDSNWFIGSQNYLADQTKIDSMLKVIQELTLTTLVSKSKNYGLYGLDKDNKIIIKAYIKEQAVREFEIGKAASTYHHTFVRIKDDDNVYHARNSFRSDFDLKMNDLRDKLVLKFDKNEISEIALVEKDISLLFTKQVKTTEKAVENKKADGEKQDETPSPTPPEVTSWVGKDGKVAKKETVDSILDQLSNLSCDEYIENKTKADFKDPAYSFKLKGRKDYELLIFAKLDKDGKYPAVSSENPYPFLLSTYKAENMMKKPEDILPEPEKKEEAKGESPKK